MWSTMRVRSNQQEVSIHRKVNILRVCSIHRNSLQIWYGFFIDYGLYYTGDQQIKKRRLERTCTAIMNFQR